MMYWLTGPAASSARLYWESFEPPASPGVGRPPIDVPTGCSIFPKEILRISRRWAETRFSDIRYWNELDRGGHFAAFEQPEALRRRAPVRLPADALNGPQPSRRRRAAIRGPR